MKERGKQVRHEISLGRISITFSNRVFYSLITFLIITIIAVGVYAYANPTTGVGHDYSELQPCGNGEILKTNSNGVWGCGTDEAGTGDNLGNHIATQNIQLNNHAIEIENDGMAIEIKSSNPAIYSQFKPNSIILFGGGSSNIITYDSISMGGNSRIISPRYCLSANNCITSWTSTPTPTISISPSETWAYANDAYCGSGYDLYRIIQVCVGSGNCASTALCKDGLL